MAQKLPLFDAGHVVRTFSALQTMLCNHVSEWSLFERHCSGDFGEVGPSQRASNHRAIGSGGRVLSAYRLHGGSTVWILTSLSTVPSSTLVLMRDEYVQRLRATKQRARAAAKPLPCAA